MVQVLGNPTEETPNSNLLDAISKGMWEWNITPTKPAVLNWGCQLTPVDLYNGHKMVICLSRWPWLVSLIFPPPYVPKKNHIKNDISIQKHNGDISCREARENYPLTISLRQQVTSKVRNVLHPSRWLYDASTICKTTTAWNTLSIY